MIFKNPEAFLLFILIAGALSYLFFNRKTFRSTVQMSSLNWSSKVNSSLRVWLRWVPLFLQVVSLSLMIVALARPQTTDVQKRRFVEGIDIMVVFDISFSMMVEDMRPGTRLDSAKKVMTEFISELHSDRVGIILFSGESYTKIPLTLDYTLLLDEIKKIQTLSDIKQGTAIGVAMANATARLRHSSSKSRVMILLTDGENNTGNISPETALKLAQESGIKIYSIGVGSQDIARVPIKQKDILGNERTIYTTIESKINKELLEKISQSTGGKFYLAKNLKTFSEIFKEIGNLEKTKVSVKEWVQFEEKFHLLVLMAFWVFITSIISSITIFGRLF